MPTDLLDAVYGCVIGGAIGDALGAPVEGWYYTEIRDRYGRVEEFISTSRGNTGALYGGSDGESYYEDYDGPPSKLGEVTDDTTLAHYICLAIVRKGGRITPDDLAAVWIDELNPNRFWMNERIIRHKLRAGVSPWESGRGAIPAGCATMAIAPIGIINAGDPDQAYLDGMHIAAVNQEDVNRDAAATLAAGVACALAPGATVEDVLACMRSHTTPIVGRAIELTMDLIDPDGDIDAFAARFYERMLDYSWPSRTWNKERYFSGSSLEIVPVTMALLELCEGDVNRCIIEGASFGRDCDTIARAVGSLAGALQGASALRPGWIATCEEGNRELFAEAEGDSEADFYSMAVRLTEALAKEQSHAQARAEQLQSWLGGIQWPNDR